MIVLADFQDISCSQSHAGDRVRPRHAPPSADDYPGDHALRHMPAGSLLGFVPLPLSLLGASAVLAVTYLLVVQAVKSRFYHRHALP
ncbi:MAG: hypothetical protein ABSH28_23820 [Acidobacteriota bacterium]